MPASTPLVSAVEFPPIAEAMGWVNDRNSNRELLNLCQAVPSYPPAEALQLEIGRLAAEPATGGYTNIFGLTELRAAYAAKVSRTYQSDISSEQVAITTGCNQAFAAAIMSVAQHGDSVILPAPHYFNHFMWLQMMGIESLPISAINDDGHPRVADAERALKPNTRAILLCTPNNPSGAVFPPHVISAFFEFARANKIALITDETYIDFRPGDAPPHDLFQRKDWEETLIHLYSFSKIYAIAGYRLGAMVAGPALLHDTAKVLDCMTICPPHIAQRAVVYALEHLDPWKDEKRRLMAHRLATLRAAFTHAGLKYQLVSSGAYFAYVKHPFTDELSKTVAMRLAKDHDLLCLPGSMFGASQEAYLRLAFANLDADKMGAVVERLIESQG
jgi:aspartate/methionine/tyrosine aminotransferase